MEPTTKFDHFLNGAEASFTPSEMRRLAISLLRLSDSIDQGWSPDDLRSRYGMLSKAGRIEKMSLILAKVADLEVQKTKVREHHLGKDLLGNPAWNMLLELFQQFAGGALVSTKSLQLIAGCPETTALRVIDRLEDFGLVERQTSESDRRVTVIGLSREGLVKVGSVLQDLDR